MAIIFIFIDIYVISVIRTGGNCKSIEEWITIYPDLLNLSDAQL